jgi:hypothetical protein
MRGMKADMSVFGGSKHRHVRFHRLLCNCYSLLEGRKSLSKSLVWATAKVHCCEQMNSSYDKAFLHSNVKAVPLHAMKALGGEKYSSYSFMTSTLDEGQWSASRPGRALPTGKGPRYPLDRRLGGPQSRSGHMLKEKSFCLCRGSKPDRPVVQAVARHYTDWATRLVFVDEVSDKIPNMFLI